MSLNDTIAGIGGLLAAANAARPDAPGVTMLDADLIDPFPNHPYQVRDDEDMERLADSIAHIGIQSPLIVRPTGQGRYQLISGHRRLHAARTLGHTQVPAIIARLDDDQATLAMVDSNQTTRTSIPLAEQARAMRMRHQATMRQGVHGAGDNRERLAAQTDRSAATIGRLIRLGGLTDRLLDRVGVRHGIPKGAALTLADLDQADQDRLADWLDTHPDTRIDATRARLLTQRTPLDPDTLGHTLGQPADRPARRRYVPIPEDAIPATILARGGNAPLAWILDLIAQARTGQAGQDTGEGQA